MEALEKRLQSIEYMLLATAGGQLAQMAILNVFVEVYKGNPQVAEAMATALEQVRANLLASSSPQYQLDAFDAVAESFAAKLS